MLAQHPHAESVERAGHVLKHAHTWSSIPAPRSTLRMFRYAFPLTTMTCLFTVREQGVESRVRLRGL